MIRLSILALCWVTLALSSCRPTSLPEEKLRAYLVNPANGLYKQCQVADLAINVFYQPADLLGIEPADPTDDNSTLPIKPNSLQYFILSISRDGHEALDPARGFSSFSNLLQTMAFRPHEYLKLITVTGDTLLPSSSGLERTYGMGTSTRLLVAFPQSKQPQDITLCLTEFGLHTGNLRFDFKRRDLMALPRLSTAANKEFAPIP